MRTKPVTVVETSIFLRQAEDIWNDEERSDLVDYIARNPDCGDSIPGTGGVRKVRWATPGSGKRGGGRVVFFYHNVDAPVYLLMAYPKSKREDMTAEERKAVTALSAALKKQTSARRP